MSLGLWPYLDMFAQHVGYLDSAVRLQIGNGAK
jgi:hypothetical protein